MEKWKLIPNYNLKGFFFFRKCNPSSRKHTSRRLKSEICEVVILGLSADSSMNFIGKHVQDLLPFLRNDK